jgi:hypothetical protein
MCARQAQSQRIRVKLPGWRPGRGHATIGGPSRVHL